MPANHLCGATFQRAGHASEPASRQRNRPEPPAPCVCERERQTASPHLDRNRLPSPLGGIPELSGISKGTFITPPQNSSRSSSSRRRRPSTPKSERTDPTQAAPVKADAAPASFAELGVPAPLVDYLRKKGKTLAFSLPMVARLAETTPGGPRKNRRPRGLILAPTSELATQITNVIDPLAQAYGMKTTTIFGGVNPETQSWPR